eukprot:gene12538-12627_t
MSGFPSNPDETVRMPPGSAWGASAIPAPPPPIRHVYPLAVRSAGFWTAFGLMLQSLPYPLIRFGILLACSIATIIWLAIMIGGAAWLGTHIAAAFGWIWFIALAVCASALWSGILRYALHMIECGHVAVLTELITKGQVGNGQESMFTYGRRVVTERFAQANVLYGLHALVRGVVNSFHRTLDWVSDLLPIPGLDSLANLISIVLRGATRYLDKVIFSYNLARSDTDPWTSSREGIVYYAQNARPVLTTAIWSIVLERVASVALWVILLIPAALITLALPASMREMGAIATILIAALLAGPIRTAFIKPIFLIMMMVRFHASIEGQPINQQWDAELANVSSQFRDFGQSAATQLGSSRLARLFS